jgi:hypothetical protein
MKEHHCLCSVQYFVCSPAAKSTPVRELIKRHISPLVSPEEKDFSLDLIRVLAGFDSSTSGPGDRLDGAAVA